MVLGDAGDHLLDDDGLADARTTEHPDLAALHVRLDQVDDLDAGLEHLRLRLEVFEVRRLAVDGPAVLGLEVLALVARQVQRLAQHVVDVAEHRGADRHRDRGAGVLDVGAAHDTIGRRHADGADATVTDVLRHLGGDLLALVTDGAHEVQRVVDLGQLPRGELDVDDGADDPDDPALVDRVFGCGCSRTHRWSFAGVVVEVVGVVGVVVLVRWSGITSRRTGPRHHRRSRRSRW